MRKAADVKTTQYLLKIKKIALRIIESVRNHRAACDVCNLSRNKMLADFNQDSLIKKILEKKIEIKKAIEKIMGLGLQAFRDQRARKR
jgi:hypothetical protein